MTRKMPREKRLVNRHILYADDALPGNQVQDLIHHEKRKPVGKNLLDGLDIQKNTLLRRPGLVLGGELLLLVYIPYLLHQSNMRGMTRSCCHHMGFQGKSQKGQIANQV